MSGTRLGVCAIGLLLLAAGCAEGSTPSTGEPRAEPTPQQTPAQTSTAAPANQSAPARPATELNGPALDSALDPARDSVPVDPTPKTFAADDPNIVYSGRVDFADPRLPTYSAPGVRVSVRFRGEAISALLGDEFRYGNEHSFHDVLIDGEIKSKIALQAGTDKYELASGLGPGEHTLALVKRTQAQLGKAMFRGFEVKGELLPPAPPPSLKIEFIGDSITAGEGIEGVNGSSDCQQNALGLPGGWGQPFHDAGRSYGVVAAEQLQAEYHLTAVSGIGLVRNYSQKYDARPMPQVYGLMFVEELASGPWETARYTPDVVVVALGTNDFSPGDAPANLPRPKMDVGMYTSAYAQFVTRLRTLYPGAEIFALSSQLLSDGPDASYTPATDLRTALSNVAQQFNAQGDSKVHAFVTTRVAGLGCSGHPNAEQHRALGRELATEIRSVLNL